MPIQVNFDFLSRVEGERQTRGYIPCWCLTRDGLRIPKGSTFKSANYYGRPDQEPGLYRVMGVSGVTIATGCDLGQTTMAVLQGYGLPQAVCSKLLRYIGLKEDAAIRALHDAPLNVTPEDAAAIDRAVHSGYLHRYVVPCYNKSDPRQPFENIPEAAQTVIMSLVYQLGCAGVKRRGPKTWQALLDGNWEDAGKKLCTQWGESYPQRRKIEGQYLLEGVK